MYLGAFESRVSGTGGKADLSAMRVPDQNVKTSMGRMQINLRRMRGEN